MLIRTPLCNLEGAGGAGAAPPVVTPTTPVTDPATPPAVVTDEPANPSKREWADFHKTQRELAKSMAAIADGLTKAAPVVRTDAPKPAVPSATPTPATADAGIADRIAGLERTAALKGVYADLGIKPGPQRDFIENVLTKGMAHDSIPSAVDAYLKTLPAPATTTAPAVVNPTVPAIPTGAAGGTGAKPDPGDLTTMDAATLASLPREERMKRYEDFRSRGPNANPYAGERTRQLVHGRK